MNYDFKSVLSPYIQSLIEKKRAYGYDYRESERILRCFDEFCTDSFPEEDGLTQPLAMKWSEQRGTENNKYRLNRISVIRELARHMNSIGVDAYVLPDGLVRKDARHIPHIYTENELRRIFLALDQCRPDPVSPARHLVIPVIYRMIYCCGLRPVEARRLKCGDVDLCAGFARILESKGHKDRIVAMSPGLVRLCARYHEKVSRIYPERVYFFPSPTDNGKAMYSMEWIIPTFRRALQAAGVYGCSGSTPRLYDLRHTFATHVIHKWLDEGRDINACLPFLSEYMGHENISDTAYYIHFAPEFYPEMHNRGGETASKIIPEVAPCK